MKKKTLKKLTLNRLVQIFSVSILSIIIIMFLGYREFFKHTVEDKTLEIANLVKAGLTSHMKADIMDKRAYFLKEITKVNHIKSITIIRSFAVNNQYGISTLKEELTSGNVDDIPKTNEPIYQWNDAEGSVNAIVPYIADSKEELNCLSCHNVKDGDILGAIEIDIDISSYQNIIVHYSYIFLLILTFFALIIIFNFFNFIEKYITDPLLHVIDDGKNAYENHHKINSKSYSTQEFEQVAQNINDFNQDVISKERALYEKNKELESLNQEIESTLKETMMAMGKIEEIRSDDTKNHTQRVAKLSALIAKAYGLSDKEIELIELTSTLHDIGKIGIEDDILLKPGKLTSSEFEIMKTHAELGYQVLKHSDRLILKTAATIAHTHHEKYNGTGYPQGLKGEGIPLFGRIVAIVDVLDALLSKRIYKDKWSLERVRSLLIEEDGKHFDPQLVKIVLDNLEEYNNLIDELTIK